jgi:hypothetical protein
VGAGDLCARDVVVYRLITCGTVEEKIYRRQVFKGGLSRAGTRDEEQLRYFSYVVRRPLHNCCTSAAAAAAAGGGGGGGAETVHKPACVRLAFAAVAYGWARHCRCALWLRSHVFDVCTTALDEALLSHREHAKVPGMQNTQPHKGSCYGWKQELRDLFSLKAEEVGASRTQADLSARHAAQRRTTPSLDAHLAQLPRLPNYVGRTPPASHTAGCCLMPAARHLLERGVLRSWCRG